VPPTNIVYRYSLSHSLLLIALKWCQVVDAVWGCLRVIKEIKSPCGGRGVAGLGLQQ
jgi:hypothetical protein